MVSLLPMLLAAMPMPFQPGETLEFEVRYLGLTAGSVSLSVDLEKGHPDRLRIRSEGRTLNAADSIFRVRSEAFCVVESGRMLPLWCRSTFTTRRTDRRREVRYDRGRGRVEETLLDGGAVEKHERELGPDGDEVQELLSAMYLTRMLSLEPGAPLRFQEFRGEKRLVVEGRPEQVEMLQTPAGPRSALRVALRVKEKVEADQSDGGHVWLSDDARRVPMRMLFEGPLGAVEVLLVRAAGLLPGPALTASAR